MIACLKCMEAKDGICKECEEKAYQGMKKLVLECRDELDRKDVEIDALRKLLKNQLLMNLLRLQQKQLKRKLLRKM